MGQLGYLIKANYIFIAGHKFINSLNVNEINEITKLISSFLVLYCRTCASPLMLPSSAARKLTLIANV